MYNTPRNNIWVNIGINLRRNLRKSSGILENSISLNMFIKSGLKGNECFREFYEENKIG